MDREGAEQQLTTNREENQSTVHFSYQLLKKREKSYKSLAPPWAGQGDGEVAPFRDRGRESIVTTNQVEMLRAKAQWASWHGAQRVGGLHMVSAWGDPAGRARHCLQRPPLPQAQGPNPNR